MLRLLQWIFVGHVHKWKTVDRKEMAWRGVTRDGCTKKEEYFRVYCECETCGEPRHWDLRA